MASGVSHYYQHTWRRHQYWVSLLLVVLVWTSLGPASAFVPDYNSATDTRRPTMRRSSFVCPLHLGVTKEEPSKYEKEEYWYTARTPPCDDHSSKRSSRRSFVSVFVATAATVLSSCSSNAVRADTGADVRGTPLNAFNGLAFQYRGNDFNGLSAADINEPSVSYADFCAQLTTGEIVLVEFFAPDGDVAYATLKDKSRVRVGEGYPIEQHDGYSSPAFAIRTVKNSGVPYRFIVSGLENYQAKTGKSKGQL